MNIVELELAKLKDEELKIELCLQIFRELSLLWKYSKFAALVINAV